MEKTKKIIQSQGWYGTDIGLKLFGETKYTSVFGGAVSILAKLAFLLRYNHNARNLFLRVRVHAEDLGL